MCQVELNEVKDQMKSQLENLGERLRRTAQNIDFKFKNMTRNKGARQAVSTKCDYTLTTPRHLTLTLQFWSFHYPTFHIFVISHFGQFA